MKINVTVTPKEAKKEERKYPYFGQHRNGWIVYFTGHEQGIAIKHKDEHYEGYISTWAEDTFTPIIGTITIEQE